MLIGELSIILLCGGACSSGSERVVMECHSGGGVVGVSGMGLQEGFSCLGR